MEKLFSPAHIVLPRQVTAQWPVVACDQFSAQPEKWREMAAAVGNAPSTLHLVFPEAFLEDADAAERIRRIHNHMRAYQEQGLLQTYPDSFVYLQRTLPDGRVRHGLIGKVDLQAYSYIPGEACRIRPTERTIAQRLPARMRIRQGAPLEFPHVLALLDDPGRKVIEPLEQKALTLPLLYDVALWGGAGRAKGFLLSGQEAQEVSGALEQVFSTGDMALSIGDGNHSLAAAKGFYTELREQLSQQEWMVHPARWALVEVENIHSPALDFAPIHRLVLDCQPQEVLSFLGERCGVMKTKTLHLPEPCPAKGWEIAFIWGEARETGMLRFADKSIATAVGALQPLLEEYAQTTPGVRLDYIHGDQDLQRLAAEKNALGFLIPPLTKGAFFSTVEQCGILPLKTFSLGQALEKRFYIEGRSITI